MRKGKSFCGLDLCALLMIGGGKKGMARKELPVIEKRYKTQQCVIKKKGLKVPLALIICQSCEHHVLRVSVQRYVIFPFDSSFQIRHCHCYAGKEYTDMGPKIKQN